MDVQPEAKRRYGPRLTDENIGTMDAHVPFVELKEPPSDSGSKAATQLGPSPGE